MSSLLRHDTRSHVLRLAFITHDHTDIGFHCRKGNLGAQPLSTSCRNKESRARILPGSRAKGRKGNCGSLRAADHTPGQRKTKQCVWNALRKKSLQMGHFFPFHDWCPGTLAPGWGTQKVREYDRWVLPTFFVGKYGAQSLGWKWKHSFTDFPHCNMYFPLQRWV